MNKKAMAYLVLAFDNMKLLRLITRAKSDEQLEGKALKVMQFLTKKYSPNNLQARFELRKRLVNLKLRFEQDLLKGIEYNLLASPLPYKY